MVIVPFKMGIMSAMIIIIMGPTVVGRTATIVGTIFHGEFSICDIEVTNVSEETRVLHLGRDENGQGEDWPYICILPIEPSARMCIPRTMPSSQKSPQRAGQGAANGQGNFFIESSYVEWSEAL